MRQPIAVLRFSCKGIRSKVRTFSPYRLSKLLFCGVVMALNAASIQAADKAADSDTLAPYLMVRSLQFVQDSVVMGDHSAADMQRFVLAKIDKRLRSADTSEFRDPRNVDAALIYTMSGGNPATLEYLVSRDVDGHFDNRVTDVLRKYLSGKGVLVASSLADMVGIYKNTRIGAYLALVAGNVTVVKDPAGALKFYDLARLLTPGTIVEEAALRRSFSLAIEVGQVQKAMKYANRYARRFLHSPYANQFADMLVQLIVDHFKQMDEQDVLATLATMDPARQREIYLRIARRSSINGNQELAALAADRAQALAGLPGGSDPQALLYGGLALIPTTDVRNALKTIEGLKESELSDSDKALLAAARKVAEDIVTLPTASNTVAAPNADAKPVAVAPATGVDVQQDPTAPQVPKAEMPTPQPSQPAVADGQKPDPAFDAFVSNGRSKLDEIDKLLKGEGGR
jgi:chemotaxis protein MotC